MTENSSSETLAPLDSFMKNMEELDALRAVYSHVSANPLINPEDMEGKTYDNDILIKSAVIFIVTCWDEFIKQLVKYAFGFMLTNAYDSDVFPIQVKMIASEKLSSKPLTEAWKKDIWRLAGDGWKEVLKDNKEEIINKFHTPRADIIDKLLLHVIGLKNLSHEWSWNNMTVANSRNCLDVLMDLRGDIVHRNKPHRSVIMNDIEYFSLFVNKLAGISANVVREYVYEQTDKYPWPDNNIRGVAYDDSYCK